MGGQPAVNRFKRNYPLIFLSLLVAFYLINGVVYLQCQSVTADEGPYYNYAMRFIKGHPEKAGNMIDDSKMPVTALNVLPRVSEQLIHPGLKKNDNGAGDIVMGRYVTLLVSVLTILLVYKWAKEFYGLGAGLFAAFLMAFCPNSIANAALVTTDSYSVLALLAVLYCTWKFCSVGSNKYFVLLSFAVAVAQIIKQTLLHLYILAPVCIILFFIVNRPPVKPKKLLLYAAGFIVINWFIINAGFYFYQTNTALGNYHFISRPFQLLQKSLPSWLPVPLPKPFIDGIDMLKHNNDLGGGLPESTFGKVTILGQTSTGGNFWYYYLVSCFYKTPVSYFIFIAAAFVLMIKRNPLKTWLSKESFLILPVVYFFIVLSLFVKIQTGMRHIIFIYPFLFILSAGIIPYAKIKYVKSAIVTASIFLAVSVLRYWGNYYPYTNEFIYDKKMAYSYVGADNLDYNQGNYFFQVYLAKHPNVQRAPMQQKAGIFLISVSDYLDVWNEGHYTWITRFKPAGEVAFSGLLIDVPAKDTGR